MLNQDQLKTICIIHPRCRIIKEADSRGSSASRDIVQNAEEWAPEKQAKFEKEGLSKGTSFTPEVPMLKEKEYWSEEVDIPFMHGYWDQFENEIDIAKSCLIEKKQRGY